MVIMIMSGHKKAITKKKEALGTSQILSPPLVLPTVGVSLQQPTISIGIVVGSPNSSNVEGANAKVPRVMEVPAMNNANNGAGCNFVLVMPPLPPCNDLRYQVVQFADTQALDTDFGKAKLSHLDEIEYNSPDVLYVNQKQYERILIRRKKRQQLVDEGRIAESPCRVRYLHESRHLHAMKRKRGDGGRFRGIPRTDADTTEVLAERSN